MDINIKLSKRAAEIIQEREEAATYLNINAALHQAANDFKGKEKETDDLETIKKL